MCLLSGHKILSPDSREVNSKARDKVWLLYMMALKELQTALQPKKLLNSPTLFLGTISVLCKHQA
jgi:hypothetical protein